MALSVDNDGIDNSGHTKAYPRERLRVPRHARRKESSSNRCCRVTDAFWPEFSGGWAGAFKGPNSMGGAQREGGRDRLYVLLLTNMFRLLRNGHQTPGGTFCGTPAN